MESERRRIIYSFIFPLIFIFIIWNVKFIEDIFQISFVFLGVYPLQLKGLVGIFTSPLIHADYNHLISNSFPILFLGAGLFYFYRPIAFKVFIIIYLIVGLWVWFGGRDIYSHIGASGVVYGLASFLFFSGIFRKNVGLSAISLLIVFLYGGLIWGMFPVREKISWESHLFGFIAGILIGIYYRKFDVKNIVVWKISKSKLKNYSSSNISGDYSDYTYFYVDKDSENNIK